MKINQFEHIIVLQADEARNKTIRDVENATSMLHPLNSSALNLATVLSAKLNGTALTFPIIQANVSKNNFFFFKFDTIFLVSVFKGFFLFIQFA